jgi:protein NrfD
MERIQIILLLVLGQMAIGGTALLALPSLATVGLSFYRTNGIVLGITLLLGYFIGGPIGSADWLHPFFIFLLLFAITLFIYNLRLWFRHPYSSAMLLWAATLLGIVSLFFIPFYIGQDISTLRRLWLFLYFVISSLLLGAGVLAMLLGHRYLTDPTLSIVPLHQLSRLFMGLVFLEGGLVIIHLIIAAPSSSIADALLLRTFEGLYLWIRLAIGIIGPMILAPMIMATVRERSTMSATGLLYVAMLMVIIGALFSHFFLLINPNLI